MKNNITTEQEDIGGARRPKPQTSLTIVSKQPQILVALERNPFLKSVVLEYHKLASKPTLTDERDLNRLVEIYEIAKSEELLDSWIDKIDSGNDLDVLSLLLSEESLSLDEFLTEAENMPHEATAEDLRQLAEKLYRSNTLDNIIEKRISFSHDERCRHRIICQNQRVNIFVKSWLPGQKTERHRHGDYLTAIYVYQGEITNEFWEEKEEAISYKGTQRTRTKAEQSNSTHLKEKDWLCLNQRSWHSMNNQSNQEGAITIHFRLYSHPTPDQEEKPTNNFSSPIPKTPHYGVPSSPPVPGAEPSYTSSSLVGTSHQPKSSLP